MNTRLIRFIALIAVGVGSTLSALAEVYTKTDGTSYDGSIYKVLEGAVYLEVGEEKISVPVAEFDASSQSAIQASNPIQICKHPATSSSRGGSCKLVSDWKLHLNNLKN